jgi:16S rRNA processing protein RimM
VRLEILSDDPARFEPGSRLHVEGSDEALTVAWSQEDGPGILVRFDEIATRSEAEALRERYLEAEAPPDALAEGEFYWHEVLGVAVTTSDGQPLGTVRDVFRAGGGEVLVVDGAARGEVLVPAVGTVITELAPRAGRIVVDLDALGLDTAGAAPRPRGRRTRRAFEAAAGDAQGTEGGIGQEEGPLDRAGA